MFVFLMIRFKVIYQSSNCITKKNCLLSLFIFLLLSYVFECSLPLLVCSLLLHLSTGSITERDIQRVANRMLKSKLSVVGYGSLAGLPSYEDMETAILTRDGRLPSKKSFSLFRR